MVSRNITKAVVDLGMAVPDYFSIIHALIGSVKQFQETHQNMGEEAFGLLHASTWTATLALHTTDPVVIWDKALGTFCDMKDIKVSAYIYSEK